MSQNEIDAASEVRLDQFNAQLQHQLDWAPSFAVARSHYDQAVRAGTLDGSKAKNIAKAIDKAERFADGPQRRAAIAQLENAARDAGKVNLTALSEALQDLADSLR